MKSRDTRGRVDIVRGLLLVRAYLSTYIELLNLVLIYFMGAYMSLYELFPAFSIDLTKPAAFFSSARLRTTPRKSSMASSDVCMCTTKREPRRDKGLGSFLARSATSA